MKNSLIKHKDIKEEKGITLIALVITIIVLLILAGVSIAMLTGQNGILTQANTSKIENIGASVEEAKELWKINKNIDRKTGSSTAQTLDELLEELKNKNLLTDEEIEIINKTEEITIGSRTIKFDIVEKVEPGEIVSKTEKDNYTDGEGKKATIPEGFKVSEVEGEKNIDSGLVVIAPDESEFVWIPVETVISDTESNGTTNKAMAVNLGTEEEPNYRGLLYSFTSSGSTVRGGCTKTTSNSNREPVCLTHSENGDGTSYNTIGLTEQELKTEYKNMIESVKKYNGFYVGRYETSLNGNTVQSKKDVKSATADENSANMWYGLYAKQKTYKTESVQGQMIWGSQYDAMMNWMQQKNKIKVSSTTPIEGAEKNADSARITGSEKKDKLNNIFDILGNSYEWSAEANFTHARVIRRWLLL